MTGTVRLVVLVVAAVCSLASSRKARDDLGDAMAALDPQELDRKIEEVQRRTAFAMDYSMRLGGSALAAPIGLDDKVLHITSKRCAWPMLFKIVEGKDGRDMREIGFTRVECQGGKQGLLQRDL